MIWLGTLPKLLKGDQMLVLGKLLDAYVTKETRVQIPQIKGDAYLLLSEDTLIKVDPELTYVYYGAFKFKLDKSDYSVVI
jgi:hypothetical protein